MTFSGELLGFFVLAAAAVACAIGMVTAKNPIHAALWLVGNFISLAVIYLMLSAPLLFAIQLIVYAGAIMVLFLFVIMFFMSPEARRWLHPPLRSQLLFGGLATLLLAGLLAWGIATGMGEINFADTFKERDVKLASQEDPARHMGDRPQDLGVWMFSYQVLPFELTSLLLLAALLGAIMVARDVREEGRGRVQHHAPVKEAAGPVRVSGRGDELSAEVEA